MNDHKKDLYVHGIVKDYNESINSLNKYLFSENERLNAIIDDLEEKIDKAIELLKNDYFEDGSGNNVNKVLEILGGDSDGM